MDIFEAISLAFAPTQQNKSEIAIDLLREKISVFNQLHPSKKFSVIGDETWIHVTDPIGYLEISINHKGDVEIRLNLKVKHDVEDVIDIALAIANDQRGVTPTE